MFVFYAIVEDAEDEVERPLPRGETLHTHSLAPSSTMDTTINLPFLLPLRHLSSRN